MYFHPSLEPGATTRNLVPKSSVEELPESTAPTAKTTSASSTNKLPENYVIATQNTYTTAESNELRFSM